MTNDHSYFLIDLIYIKVLIFYMKKGRGKTIPLIFTGKFGLFVLIPVIGVLIGIAGFPSVKGCISDNLDRRAVLDEVQDARDRLDGVLLGRQLDWRITNTTELKFAGRITHLFSNDESLVKELQKLYRSLAAGISNAKELRQVLASKEADPTDAVNLENAIRRVVEEADLIGPRLSAKVGGTWQKPPKNLTKEELANHYLIKYKEASGNINAVHKMGKGWSE